MTTIQKAILALCCCSGLTAAAQQSYTLEQCIQEALTHNVRMRQANNKEEAETKFKEASEAYEVLSNAEKKQQYDQFGHAAFDQTAGGGAYGGTGSDISISGDAKVKVQGGEADNYYYDTGTGAGIGNGGTYTAIPEDDDGDDYTRILVDGDEVKPDTSGLTENGRLEYYAPGADMETDDPEKVIENKPETGAQPGASAPVYSVTDKDGNAVSYTAAREGGVLTIRVDAAYARLTLTADEAQALTAQGVEKVVFITTGATSAFRPADLTAYKDEAPFVLTHDGETVTFTAGETDLASLLLQA